MKNNLLKLPGGVKDSLPGEASQKRALENILVDAFSKWGYAEVQTPTFEFYNVIKNDELFEDQLFKFIDREGHILSLRSDMTTPIARMVSTHFQDRLYPLRLFYLGNVYRYESTQTGRQREFCQAGVELIGANTTSADTEVITLAIESLLACNLTDFKIGIGQVKIIQSLLEQVIDDVEALKNIKLAIINKDFVGLEALLNATKGSKEVKAKILSLVSLHGDERVLAEAKKLLEGEEYLALIKQLEEINENIQASGLGKYIFFDFSILRDFDYYTGMVFEGYAHSLGYPVLGGGRYDTLLERFSTNAPATGFALGLERIILALNKEEQKEALDIFLTGASYQSLSKKAKDLRDEGYKVAVDLMGLSLAEAENYAKELGCKKVVTVQEEDQ